MACYNPCYLVRFWILLPIAWTSFGSDVWDKYEFATIRSTIDSKSQKIQYVPLGVVSALPVVS